jgi:integrase
MIAVAIQTGLRVSELTSLNCADVTWALAPPSTAKAEEQAARPRAETRAPHPDALTLVNRTPSLTPKTLSPQPAGVPPAAA